MSMAKLIRDYSHSSARTSLQLMEEGLPYSASEMGGTELSVPGSVQHSSTCRVFRSERASPHRTASLNGHASNMLRHVIAEDDRDEALVLETKQLKKQLRQVKIANELQVHCVLFTVLTENEEYSCERSAVE